MRVLLSLTTTSQRIATLPKVLATLCRQTRPADEIHLFLSKQPFFWDQGVGRLPAHLGKFVTRNHVQVHYVANTGPYRKLLPLLQTRWRDDVAIITVDDDTLYPPDLFERLLQAYRIHDCIVAASGRRVLQDSTGKLRPYLTWPKCLPRENVDLMNFPLGQGGVLYRPVFFTKRIFDARARAICPLADDIWFRCNSWLGGVPACILGGGESFPQLEEYCGRELFRFNQQHNDRQIQATASYLRLSF